MYGFGPVDHGIMAHTPLEGHDLRVTAIVPRYH